MRSLKGTVNKYARRQVRREISKYVHSQNNYTANENVEVSPFMKNIVIGYLVILTLGVIIAISV